MTPRLHGLLFLAILILTASCNYREDKLTTNPLAAPEDVPGPGGPPPQSGDWFTVLKAKVFQPKCIQCHEGMNAKGQVDLTNYEALMNRDPPVILPFNPEESGLFQVIKMGAMPPSGPLSEDEISAVYDWIKKGAPKTKE